MVRRNELAMKIKVLRAEKDMTQIELAEKSGVSVCAIHLIENCKKSARVETLIKLSKALNVEPNELLQFVY